MDNMVTNVCVKSNGDRLHIDKALGFWKSDNNNKKHKNKKSKNNVCSDWGPLPGLITVKFEVSLMCWNIESELYTA